MAVIPMAPEAFLWIYEDHPLGIALVRGKNIKSVLETAGVLEVARWSHAGKGFVLPLEQVPDVVAAAEHIGVPYRFKTAAEAAR